MANGPRRCPGVSYQGHRHYFLTICANQRAPVLADPVVARLVADQFLLHAVAEHFATIAYCAMPDHFHAIVLGESETADLPRLVRRWKQWTGYWWKQRGNGSALWQRGYHERVLRDDEPVDGVVRYVLLNPVRAGLVSDPRDYPFAGSSTYDITTLLESSCMWVPSWK